MTMLTRDDLEVVSETEYGYGGEVARDVYVAVPRVSLAGKRQRTPAFLLSRAQSDIEFLLGGGGGRIQRSTSGLMLERVEMYAYAKGDDGSISRLPPRPEGCVQVQSQRSEAGYELDFMVLAKLGRANRLLDAVERESLIYATALHAFHGDRGARWGCPYRSDSSGGVGNREVVLYPLTEMGRDWIAAIRKTYPLSGALRPDEVLANEYAASLNGMRTDKRTFRLSRCAAQARKLIQEATDALQAVAVAHDADRAALRATSLRAAAHESDDRLTVH